MSTAIESKCVSCQNAVPNRDGSRGCSWSREFKPVEGWEATPFHRKTVSYDYTTYTVYECPEFIPDPPRKPRKEGMWWIG